MDVVLYTREGCHLCEEAQRLLFEHGLSPRLVDIDHDDSPIPASGASSGASSNTTTCHRYDQCIPVVVIDGVERFRGRVNPVLLVRLLRAERRKHAGRDD